MERSLSLRYKYIEHRAVPVLMVKHYAEQWFFWIAANLFCIYMWVLPALDGEGSMPIVVMWTVFTINSFIGFYKWVIVKDGK